MKKMIQETIRVWFTADDYDVIGDYTRESFRYGSEVITIDEALQAWTNTLEEIYPTNLIMLKKFTQSI